MAAVGNRRASEHAVTSSEFESTAHRMWILQYGPCWCGGVPGNSGSFSLTRFRTYENAPGLAINLLIVTQRVLKAATTTCRDIYRLIPEPRVVISTAYCPRTGPFWDNVPGGWAPADGLVPVSSHIDACVFGRPETLVTGVISLVGSMFAPIAGAAGAPIEVGVGGAHDTGTSRTMPDAHGSRKALDAR